MPVTGRVLHRSDTSDLPDIAWDDGLVLVVPAVAAADFWAALGEPTQGPKRISHLEIVVDRSALPAAVEAARIGPDGAFESETVDDAALMCLADEAAGAPDSYRLRGCADVSAEGGEAVTLSFGLGGLMVDIDRR